MNIDHPLVQIDKFTSLESYCLHLMHRKAYLEASGVVENKVVLDLGCNNGYGSALLAQTASRVVGLDVSSAAIAEAANKFSSGNLEFQAYDGSKLPFPDDHFDVVVSFQVIEHVVDVRGYLKEINRVSKPGGVIYFTTPNADIRLDPGMKPWNEHHIREYSHGELQSLLREAFSRVDVMGLFGTPEFSQIEYRRCAAARDGARSAAARALVAEQVGWRNRVDRATLRLKKILKIPILYVYSAFVGGKKPAILPDFGSKFTIDDLYYDERRLGDALDLMALCRAK